MALKYPDENKKQNNKKQQPKAKQKTHPQSPKKETEWEEKEKLRLAQSLWGFLLLSAWCYAAWQL